MSKIRFNKGLDEILGKSKGFLFRLYREAKNKGFETEVSDYVMNTQHDEISLGELAEQYNLTEEFQAYIRSDVLGGIRGNLSKAYYWTSSVKDGLENMMQAFTAAGEGATAVESGGLTILVGEGAEVPAELILQGVYNYLATTFGFLSGTYTLGKQGFKNYARDLGASNLDAILNMVPGPGFLEYFTNLGDPIKSIKQASASRARYWLVQKIKETNPAVQINDFQKETDLVERISQMHDKIKEKTLNFKEKIIEYKTNIHDNYFNDLFSKSEYNPVMP